MLTARWDYGDRANLVVKKWRHFIRVAIHFQLAQKLLSGAQFDSATSYKETLTISQIRFFTLANSFPP